MAWFRARGQKCATRGSGAAKARILSYILGSRAPTARAYCAFGALSRQKFIFYRIFGARGHQKLVFYRTFEARGHQQLVFYRTLGAPVRQNAEATNCCLWFFHLLVTYFWILDDRLSIYSRPGVRYRYSRRMHRQHNKKTSFATENVYKHRPEYISTLLPVALLILLKLDSSLV